MKCHCGERFEAIYSKNVRSCGCLKNDKKTGHVINGVIIYGLDKAASKLHEKKIYKMKCHCGFQFYSEYDENIKSCGCHRFPDREGQSINGIKVFGRTMARSHDGDYVYEMKCHCGKIFYSLWNKDLKSCGCEDK